MFEPLYWTVTGSLTKSRPYRHLDQHLSSALPFFAPRLSEKQIKRNTLAPLFAPPPPLEMGRMSKSSPWAHPKVAFRRRWRGGAAAALLHLSPPPCWRWAMPEAPWAHPKVAFRRPWRSGAAGGGCRRRDSRAWAREEVAPRPPPPLSWAHLINDSIVGPILPASPPRPSLHTLTDGERR